MFVYRISCNQSKNDYVGVTNNINRRWLEHNRANTHVGNAIRKYNW